MHTKRTLIVLASVILLAIVSIRCLPFAFDDAYIHFRIAKNLAADGLPFFNTGESVMATSSPVWTIVLGILALLPVRLAVIVALINSLFTVLGALVWSHVLQQIAAKELSRALRWGFSVAYIGVLLPSSVGLMETPLAMLLFGWGALLLIQSKPVAWTVLAFAAFTRYELVTFAVLAGAVQLTITRKNAVRGALLFAVPAAILSLLLVICFSSPIPQTVVAKQIVYSLSRSQVLDWVFYNLVPPLDHPALALQVAWPVQVFVSNLVAQVGAWGMILFAALVCCTLPLFRMLSDKQQRWGMCIGATGVLIAIAYVIKHVFLHEWYAPLFCIPILAFAFSVAQRNILARALAVILSLLPVATIAEYSLATVEKPSILRAARPGARVQRYMQVGALLHKLFPDARLMTSEIGGLGISFRGTILDGAGLITPAALRYHPLPGATSGVGGIPAGLIREMKPELIVSYPVFLLDTRNTDAMQDYIRLSMPAFSRKYQQLLGASDLWGSDTLLVFVRRDIADQKKIDILKRKLHAAEDSGH